MKLLSRIGAWLVTPFRWTTTPLFSVELLDPLPKHEEWDAILVRESLRRCGGNYKSAALLIGRSVWYMRRIGK